MVWSLCIERLLCKASIASCRRPRRPRHSAMAVKVLASDGDNRTACTRASRKEVLEIRTDVVYPVYGEIVICYITIKKKIPMLYTSNPSRSYWEIDFHYRH